MPATDECLMSVWPPLALEGPHTVCACARLSSEFDVLEAAGLSKGRNVVSYSQNGPMGQKDGVFRSKLRQVERCSARPRRMGIHQTSYWSLVDFGDLFSR